MLVNGLYKNSNNNNNNNNNICKKHNCKYIDIIAIPNSFAIALKELVGIFHFKIHKIIYKYTGRIRIHY